MHGIAGIVKVGYFCRTSEVSVFGMIVSYFSCVVFLVTLGIADGCTATKKAMNEINLSYKNSLKKH